MLGAKSLVSKNLKFVAKRYASGEVVKFGRALCSLPEGAAARAKRIVESTGILVQDKLILTLALEFLASEKDHQTEKRLALQAADYQTEKKLALQAAEYQTEKKLVEAYFEKELSYVVQRYVCVCF
jgi:hypothetical protein